VLPIEFERAELYEYTKHRGETLIVEGISNLHNGISAFSFMPQADLDVKYILKVFRKMGDEQFGKKFLL